jgi:hypothetical protein
MDDPNTTTGTFESDEAILTYTVLDEALEETAADTEKGRPGQTIGATWVGCTYTDCCS